LRRIIKVLMGIITFLIIAAIGLGVYAYSYIKGYVIGSSYTSAPPITVSGNEYTLDTDVINILLIGVDYDSSRVGEGLRSDTLMLLSVNTVKKTATLISIPRDTRAKVNKLNSSGKVTSTVTTKINAAFSYGGGSSESTSTFGNRSKNAIAAVEALLNDNGRFDVQIDYYLLLDMDAIAPCVDAIGGIDVTLDEDMPNLDSDGYLGKAGQTIHLNGEKAEAYIRVRKGGSLDGSDTSRAARQREFVKLYLQKLKSANPVTTIPTLYSKLQEYVYTNMDLDKILALAMILKDADLSNLDIEVIPGQAQTISGVSYYIANRTKLDEMIADLFYNSVMPESASKTSATSTTKATATTKATTTKATATPTKKVTATPTSTK